MWVVSFCVHSFSLVPEGGSSDLGLTRQPAINLGKLPVSCGNVYTLSHCACMICHYTVLRYDLNWILGGAGNANLISNS